MNVLRSVQLLASADSWETGMQQYEITGRIPK